MPITHTIGHSVLMVGLATGIVLIRPRLRPIVSVIIGWAGHIGADLIVAYPKFLVNYFWPVLAVRPTPDDPFLAYWLEYATSPLGALEAAAVVAAAAMLWIQRSI